MNEDMNANTSLDGISRIVAMHIAGNGPLDALEKNESIAGSSSGCMYVVFAQDSFQKPANAKKFQWVVFPKDASTSPKQKNFIIDWCKSKSFKGFLHMVESSISFNEKTLGYMSKLENAMKALDYNVHLSTTTDRCNFVFSKFSPRLTITVDDEDMKAKLGLPDKIFFTSHSNVSYVTYDFAAVGECPPKFDERFTIGMYYIIEFLARRRATRKPDQLYYMNQYLSISNEIGAFDIISHESNDISNEDAMKAENALFKSLNIDYSPDNNIDFVLESLYATLKKKMS